MSFVLVIITCTVGSVAAIWCYRNALASARALQDGILVQVANIAATSRGVSTDPGSGSATSGLQGRGASPSGLGGASPSGMWRVTDAATDIDIVTLPDAEVPPTTADGLGELTLAGQDVRVVVVRRADGRRLLVSQPIAVRDQIASQAAGSTMLPFAVLIPLLLASIVVTTRLFLRPADHLAAAVRGRDPDDLTPVDETKAPRELVGFLQALNGQMTRVRSATEHEHLFLSQAAHELRTPLTAMSLQLERAFKASDLVAMEQRLAELRLGMQRTRHVVEQLLDLAAARSTSSSSITPSASDAVEVRDLLQDIVDELLPLADAYDVEIEVDAALGEPLAVPETATTSIIRNLLDNAIKYGAHPGTVRITTRRTAGHVVIEIDDAGNGVDDPSLASQPFHREARSDQANRWGSGLGLAIVMEQARRIGASVTLSPTLLFPRGTRATSVIPIVLTSATTSGVRNRSFGEVE